MIGPLEIYPFWERLVIKTLALPILVQCFTVLPDPPDHIIKSLQNIFIHLYGMVRQIK